MLVKLLLLFCLAYSPLASPIALARWQSPGYLLDSFIEIAMRNEYSAEPGTVRKWTQPINYIFAHRVADRALHEQLSTLHLAHLSAITGLSIRPAGNAKAANLLIVFSTENQLQNDLLRDFGIQSKQQRDRLFHNSVCLGSFSTSPEGLITRAVVVIPVDRARAHAKLVACIVEELTQVMGLPNDSEKVFPSIFNDKSVDSLLTGLDYLLLKMLYDPRVKAGMNRQQITPVLREIINGFVRKKALETAEKKVSSGGLYPLLNY